MNPFLPLQIIGIIFGIIVVVAVLRSIRIVPAQTVLVVERLGKFAGVLNAGFHVLVPFLDKVAYTHSLKEQAVDVPAQPCFTWDNVKVDIDGVLYYRVVDPRRASYAIADYRYATIQLAQTTMRSVIGKLDLDRSFEERDSINAAIVKEVDAASQQWGVDVTRYEIQNIRVPDDVLEAMEVQLRADREKRAVVARSLGEKEAKINYSVGIMEEAINRSEGEKERRVNEAEGRAAEIRAISTATAASLRHIAQAMETAGGADAVALQIVEQYIGELGALARKNTQVVLPLDLTDMHALLEQVRTLVRTPGARS